MQPTASNQPGPSMPLLSSSPDPPRSPTPVVAVVDKTLQPIYEPTPVFHDSQDLRASKPVSQPAILVYVPTPIPATTNPNKRGFPDPVRSLPAKKSIFDPIPTPGDTEPSSESTTKTPLLFDPIEFPFGVDGKKKPEKEVPVDRSFLPKETRPSQRIPQPSLNPEVRRKMSKKITQRCTVVLEKLPDVPPTKTTEKKKSHKSSDERRPRKEHLGEKRAKPKDTDLDNEKPLVYKRARVSHVKETERQISTTQNNLPRLENSRAHKPKEAKTSKPSCKDVNFSTVPHHPQPAIPKRIETSTKPEVPKRMENFGAPIVVPPIRNTQPKTCTSSTDTRALLEITGVTLAATKPSPPCPAEEDFLEIHTSSSDLVLAVEEKRPNKPAQPAERKIDSEAQQNAKLRKKLAEHEKYIEHMHRKLALSEKARKQEAEKAENFRLELTKLQVQNSDLQAELKIRRTPQADNTLDGEMEVRRRLENFKEKRRRSNEASRERAERRKAKQAAQGIEQYPLLKDPLGLNRELWAETKAQRGPKPVVTGTVPRPLPLLSIPVRPPHPPPRFLQ